MTLDELIKELEEIRLVHGGDIRIFNDIPQEIISVEVLEEKDGNQFIVMGYER